MLGANNKTLTACSAIVCFEFKIFCITGMTNAAVLPEPVRARRRTSLPSISKGIAFSCIKVGVIQPSLAIALKNIYI